MIKIKMNTEEGVTLLTKDKYCADDIYVELGDALVEKLGNVTKLENEIVDLKQAVVDAEAKTKVLETENNNLKEGFGIINQVLVEKDKQIQSLNVTNENLRDELTFNNNSLKAILEGVY